MLDECSEDCCLSQMIPEQVHISLIGNTHTQMGITWATLDHLPSIVQFGTEPSKLTSTLIGTSSTYTKGGWNGWLHKAKLFTLTAGTQYYYRVGDGANSWSKVFNFRTEPLSSNRVLRIASIGDMGNQNSEGNMKQLQKMAANQEIDLIIHNGDISYADGYQGKWDTFLRSMEDVTAYVPYMVTPGNHEVGVIGELNLGLGYINRFILPGKNSIGPDLQNLYYSWNYGLAHFIALDTESVLNIALITQEQVDWLKQDLAQVDRKVTPWIIVFGHRPFYCSNGDDDCGIEAGVLRLAVESLLNQYKTDLVLMAHKHDYERFWPTNSTGLPILSYDNPGAPVYILNGAGGNREGLEGIKVPLPNSAKALSAWGVGTITIYNRTTLQWDFTSGTGSLLDSVVLKVNH